MPEQPDEAAAGDDDVFDDAPDRESPAEPGPSASSAVEDVMSTLFEAAPEAAEHLLKAAQELLLAAKAVVDAGERVVDQHRSSGAGLAGPVDGAAGAHDEPRVRRIDLA